MTDTDQPRIFRPGHTEASTTMRYIHADPVSEDDLRAAMVAGQ